MRRTAEPGNLDARLSQRDACKTMVGLLELAGLHGVEAVLAGQLDALLESGELAHSLCRARNQVYA